MPTITQKALTKGEVIASESVGVAGDGVVYISGPWGTDVRSRDVTYLFVPAVNADAIRRMLADHIDAALRS